MSAATLQQPPAIPPRPSRSQEKADSSSSLPKIPPRPAGRRYERSISPGDRFAQSPLNDTPFPKSPRIAHFSPNHIAPSHAEDPIERSGSVAMPSVGEEGTEYEAVADELEEEKEKEMVSSSPEHTRTVGHDLKLHAPKPSLPAQSAKQRVATVTRTDSDRAASFGIGRPSSEEPAYSKGSIKKKASTSQLSTSESHVDEEHGIPEIGRQVPMYPNAGDVQAPSPAPSSSIPDIHKPRHHSRKLSARSFVDLPPGSYGLHSHGIHSSDKLDKAYYEKHPEVRQWEHSAHYKDRQFEYARTSTELNKIVRDTASRASGLGTSSFHGTPSDEIGFQAQQEYASRMSSPRPQSTGPKPDNHILSPLTKDNFKPDIAVSKSDGDEAGGRSTIHVEESNRRKSHVHYGDDEPSGQEDSDETPYTAPILASDEVAKDPSPYEMHPAVEPPPERRGSVYEIEDPPSRPTSRPGSIYNPSHHDFEPTPLEDVREYEPLFTEEGKGKESKKQQSSAEKFKARHKFPSKDVWEDAPNSVHYTTEVSTPEVSENQPFRRPKPSPPEHRVETPAHAFARHQEELAEKEARQSREFLPRGEKQSTWLPLQPITPETRPSQPPRFPSRDVWEDTPDSLMYETTVSTPQQAASEEKPEVPDRPTKKMSDPSSGEKPSVPERPRTRKSTGEDAGRDRPVVSDKPKPQIPARPTRVPATDKTEEPAVRAKPAVPIRPSGGKIAALQAGFMSDLNKRLQLGPQAPKKEEPAPQDEPEQKEKVPLSDARKGRARGPQRRAPAKSPSPAVALESGPEARSLSLILPMTNWSIDEEGSLQVDQPEATDSENKESTVEETGGEGNQAKESGPKGSEGKQSPTTELEKEESTKESVEPEHEETKTLAANMAGETVVEATVAKEADEVEPVAVEETAKD